MPLEYKVKLETFEGPLELLLDLIEKRKLFINEISLAAIADDYIAHLKSFEKLPVDFVSNFLIVASTLILIKSKSLLPTLSLTQEETQDIHELENRLRELKQVREFALHVKKLFGAEMSFQKGQSRLREVVFAPTEEIKTQSIFDSMWEVIARFPQKVTLPKVLVKKVISLEEVMSRLAERITANLKMSFREFAGVAPNGLARHDSAESKEEKIMVIVSFLAMLELVKQGILAVTQESHDADIHMETGVLETPKYGVSSS